MIPQPVISNLESLQEQYKISKDLGCRPSELAGISDAWAAYFWDDIVWRVAQYDLGKKQQNKTSTEVFGAFG